MGEAESPGWCLDGRDGVWRPCQRGEERPAKGRPSFRRALSTLATGVAAVFLALMASPLSIFVMLLLPLLHILVGDDEGDEDEGKVK